MSASFDERQDAPKHGRTAQNLSLANHSYVGCAGWSIPRASAAAFEGSGTHLERYARVLRCAEINSTFYRSSRSSTWRRWAESVPGDFRFSVKAPKALTHEHRLVCSREQLAEFLDEAQLLGSRLGPLLLQLPPKLAFDAERDRKFFEMLRSLYAGNVVLEPRHASWFVPEVEDLLLRFKVARVAADPSIVPEAALPGGAPKVMYFRLHGSPRVYYTEYGAERLEKIAATMRTGLQQGAEVWCIFDNTASGAAAADALHLQQLLREPRAEASVRRRDWCALAGGG